MTSYISGYMNNFVIPNINCGWTLISKFLGLNHFQVTSGQCYVYLKQADIYFKSLGLFNKKGKSNSFKKVYLNLGKN